MVTNTSGLAVGQRENSNTGDLMRQILVVLATVAVLVVNTLATTLPINGRTTGEISDQFDVLFVPAGYVFSIWGVIYLALIGYTIYQVLPSQRSNPLLRQTGYPYVVSSVANVSWILAWHYQLFPLSVAIMLILLGTLIVIYRRIQAQPPASTAGRWLVAVPFSIYLGWISVATIANVTTLLNYWNWGGWGITPAIWAVIMLGIASVLGLFFALRLRDAAYTLVLAWAFAGIAVKHSDVSLVMNVALVAAILMVGSAGVAIFNRVRGTA